MPCEDILSSPLCDMVASLGIAQLLIAVIRLHLANPAAFLITSRTAEGDLVLLQASWRAPGQRRTNCRSCTWPTRWPT